MLYDINCLRNIYITYYEFKKALTPSLSPDQPSGGARRGEVLLEPLNLNNPPKQTNRSCSIIKEVL
jgi:hypothetical protein